MPTSKKKILANRRNSKKSTGPVSNEGKLKSSLNSMNMGFMETRLLLSVKMLMTLMISLID